MKNMLTRPAGTHFTARLLRSTAVLFTGVALGFALWTATAPMSIAQGMSPTQMIEANLPQGRTLATATKPQLLAAVCAAIKKNRGDAPQIVRVAVAAHKPWTTDIVRTAFNCVGSRDCRLLGQIFHAAVSSDPDDASALTDLATSLAPDCASSFQGNGNGNGEGEGNFGNGPGNVNPPPGSIGGGAGQGNTVAICHNGRTIFVSPRAAEAFLRQGDTLGPCRVTPTQNP
ncbi:MAG: hypothetical protein M3Y80_11225 [Verrucomicrobiota bacterium]|nr:hypothetical protein [Verrucomicrobiota bacterium]